MRNGEISKCLPQPHPDHAALSSITLWLRLVWSEEGDELGMYIVGGARIPGNYLHNTYVLHIRRIDCRLAIRVIFVYTVPRHYGPIFHLKPAAPPRCCHLTTEVAWIMAGGRDFRLACCTSVFQ